MFDIPKTPWELVARQRNIVRKLWNRDYDLTNPVISINWPYEFDSSIGKIKDFGYFSEAVRRVNDPEFDVFCQIESVRHQIECLEASVEVGHVLANVPAFDLIHFGTAPLATAFGSQMMLREGLQPAFEAAVHTPEEVMRLKKPDLFRAGICPQILDRIQYYNQATRGEVILSPCDTAGPWSIATSIWHYEDMLEAIYTAPEAVHYLLDLVTESIIEWYNIQETYIGRWGRTHTSFSTPFFQRGIFIGDDCMVTVSPAIWEEFFMPYNNRLSREYGRMIMYHCCMRYDGHFDAIAKTDGFIGCDAQPSHNDFEKIAATLEKNRAIWTRQCGPEDMDFIRRLAGKTGMLFAVNGRDRADAIRQTMAFLADLATVASIGASARVQTGDVSIGATNPAGRRILFLGNSITFHPPKPEIDWTNNCGMAASAQEKDYVHLLLQRFTAAGDGKAPEARIETTVNVADFERQYATYPITTQFKESAEFKADTVILCISENVPGLSTQAEQDQFQAAVKELLTFVKGNVSPAIYVRSGFWPDRVKDGILRQVCTELGGTFVDISRLGSDPKNYARSERKFSHDGVAGHPGDAGMAAIAEAIWKAVQERK